MSTEKWIKAANIEDLNDGEGFETDIEINGETVGLFFIKGKYYALGECSHEQAPLCQGIIEENVVTCPWHSAKFDITTGKNLEASSACRVTGNVTLVADDVNTDLSDCNTYQVKVENDEIFILEP